jgi:hypothetical protein
MFNSLNAGGYAHSVNFYNAEFENILSKIVVCYNLMMTDSIQLKNDENAIRDVLLINYLKNNQIRQQTDLTRYLFDREVPEDTSIGRTDIKIQTQNTFFDTAAYYTIECKRLDAINCSGTSGLNAKYIENAVCRFVSKTYSAYYRTNGMIGFMVQALDSHENVKLINKLLQDSFKQANTTSELYSHALTNGFRYCYCSNHTHDEGEITLYHLMLDVSTKILS